MATDFSGYTEYKINKVCKWSIRFFILIGLFLILFSVIQIGCSKRWNERLDVEEFQTEFVIEYPGGKETVSELPFSAEAKRGEITTCSFTYSFSKGRLFLFRLAHQKVKAFLNDKQVYQFGYGEEPYCGRTPGSKWVSFYLPSGGNQEVRLEFETIYDSYGASVPVMMLGTSEGFIHYFLAQLKYSFVEFALMMIGLLVLITGVIIKLRNRLGERMIYVSLIMILVSSWMLLENRAVQFFLGNPIMIVRLVFIIFPLIPIVVMALLTTYEEFGRRRSVRILSYLTACGFLCVQLLQVFHIADYVETNIITFCMDLLITLCITVTFLYQLKHGKLENRDLYLSAAAFAFFGLIDGFCYFLGSMKYNLLSFTQIGFLLFIVILATWTIKTVIQDSTVTLERKLYKKLAYTDMMTGLPNRTSYEETLNDFREKGGKPIIAVVDINRLKFINDEYGHKFGDDAIMRVAGILQAKQDETTQVFRIGGDEFCIFRQGGTEEAFREMLDEIEEELKDSEKEVDYPLGVAIGCTKVGDASVDEAFTIADRNMYQEKLRKHKESEGKEEGTA